MKTPDRLPLVLMLLALAFSSANAEPQSTGGGDEKRRLIEQKIRLLETLLNSPAANATPADSGSAALLGEGRLGIERARKSLDEARFDEAGKALDEAMKAVGKATRRGQADLSLTASAQRKTYRDQSEQIAAYRKSVVDLSAVPATREAALDLLKKVDQHTAEAARLMAEERPGEANRQLAGAYKLVTEEIARLRQGQVVHITLKFETPADEFAYEEKRFNSNRILADMLIADGKAEGDRRKLVDPFLAEAGRLGAEAIETARQGRHPDAVKQMERANGQLNRALQLMGVPVF